MKYSTAQRFLTGSVLVFVTVAGTSFEARAGSDDITCRLEKLGDCCSVTLSPQHDVDVRTTIDTAAQKGFVVIVDNNAFDCIYEFDGQMKVPERIYAGGFTGTWIGGDFSLRYKTDDGTRGACPLEVYYVQKEFVASGSCLNGHVGLSPPETNNTDSEGKDTEPVEQSTN